MENTRSDDVHVYLQKGDFQFLDDYPSFYSRVTTSRDKSLFI